MELGRHPDDQRLAADVERLRRTDPDVARWWDDHTDKPGAQRELCTFAASLWDGTRADPHA
jgi:MmyB-like transcription regulator ligand binding domain